MKRHPLVIIFITVLIDLIGFGMIIPLNPYLARTFGATASQVGWLMTIYSLMQFICSPFWGRLSDRIGRRPVLLVCLLGVGMAHLGFAFAPTLFWLFLARLVAGLFGANISTAMAYIADVTPPKDRSKGMGIIGAAFGLGFLIGPFVGGLLASVGTQLGSAPPFGPSFGAVIAALVSLLNMTFAWFLLPESLNLDRASTDPPVRRASRFASMLRYLGQPTLGPLMLVYFAGSFAMAHMEATLFLYMQDRFGWDLMKASFGFAYVGAVMVFTQGYLIRKLLPKFGEARLLPSGQILAMLGFAGMALAPSVAWMAVAVTFLGLGIGMTNPSLSGAMSLMTNSSEQGRMLGLNQSLSALGRILGPVTGGYCYQMYFPASPFAIASLLMFCGLLIAVSVVKGIPDVQKQS
jgi:MFS family permease